MSATVTGVSGGLLHLQDKTDGGIQLVGHAGGASFTQFPPGTSVIVHSYEADFGAASQPITVTSRAGATLYTPDYPTFYTFAWTWEPILALATGVLAIALWVARRRAERTSSIPSSFAGAGAPR
jgi:hypothetical protein